MKVKIEDFLLAMGEYCKEHDVGECCPENCKEALLFTAIS